MIKVLFFAHLKDQVGVGNIEVQEDQLTVKSLLEKVVKEYSLSDIDHIMVSINEEYAVKDDIIRSGDVVALIPPVSGG
ncbi:molybdopterin converting factor subunit 1 [Bacillus salitolerans]|uniref:Molybdopterin synthase sulfur carrier subunit n=1 Tax=Bacillus salitolerans TaxID=1437434 RepID=A0ABW4LRE5_9BACI